MCRCLDLSRDRNRLALVDEHSCLHVYDAEASSIVWSVEGAVSATWNTQLDDILAWSDGESLYTRTGELSVQCHALLIQASFQQHHTPVVRADVVPDMTS